MIKDLSLIIDMAIFDFKNKYLGSYLGVVWALINPIINISIFLFVFLVGFKTQSVSNHPFVVWLCVGIIPWFFFADAFMNASLSIVNYNYLVKKIVFRISYLPIIRILSSIFMHVVFIVLLIAMLIYFGIYPNLYWLQFFYYLFASIILLMGLSLVSASLCVFTKDTFNIISVFIQFGFWLTPIFWNIAQIPTKFHSIIKLNPVFYIVQGYRDAFIDNIWFWDRRVDTCYFWIITVLFFAIGFIVFKKLKPHFADVL